MEQGRAAVAEVLKRLGVDDAGWALADGSGLSRTDLVTPRGLVALLAAMDRHPHAAAFRDSLPIAGVDGTLEKRMRGTAAEKRVLAKTGTLQLANALAGYVTTTRGERLAFALVRQQPRRPRTRGRGGDRPDRRGARGGTLMELEFAIGCGPRRAACGSACC